MQRQHRELAEAFGDQPAQVVQTARERASRLEPDGPHMTAAAAMTFARDRNLERDAVVDERALLRDALTRSMGQLRLRDVQIELDRRIEISAILSVRQPASAPSRAFTTREMVALEREAIGMMQAGQWTQAPLGDSTPREIENHHPHLNEHQRAAVDQILRSRDQIMGLEGVAGAGKNMALAAVRDEAEHTGYQVRGFAPTSRATQVLEEAGIPSSTLQRHLANDSEAIVGARHLYIVDESSLASTRQIHEFLRRLGPEDRVLLVGDVRQHEAVDAGRLYQQLRDAGMQTARLEAIVRQRDPALKAVVEELSRGNTGAALHQLDAQGRVHEIGDRDERLAAIACEYLKKPDGTLVVSPDNLSRQAINDVIHRSRQTVGQVEWRQYRVRVLEPRQEVTGADRQVGGTISTG